MSMIGDVRDADYIIEDLANKISDSEKFQSRPTSGFNGSGRRALPVTDEDVDLILASRVKKISIEIPHINKEMHYKQSSRLRMLILDSSSACRLDRKDFLHLLGEANGKQYNDCGRPELEIHSIRLAEQAHSLILNPGEQQVADGSIPMLLKGFKSVSFIFDPAKQVYVLSDQVRSVLLMCMYVWGPAREAIGKLALTSAECKFGKETYSVLDSFRQRLWRRALREYFEPVLSDAVRMESVTKVFLKAAAEASSNLDGCLPDHLAEEAGPGPDLAAEEAEEAERVRLAAEAAAAASTPSSRRGAGKKPHSSKAPPQANLTQPRAAIVPRPTSGSPKRTTTPPPRGVGSGRRSSVAQETTP